MSKRNSRSAMALVVAVSLSFGAQAATGPKYKAEVPAFLQTPDKVQTELLGELERGRPI
jgi:hypothetical protein